ncbi:SRPBCC family protein [Neorhizobium sp. Rsf11]|uniref:SRPBCC family protein n=2 Tax=Neorhizobium TaxID=1525371 RepID=A0ABV0M184_9HYPH|nr:SRPBCC family protein [Neorhizobium petrolearium]MCC2610615.1 SRPBCC family protein [Neorhizobium petrolearium]WGI70751.1 SRPBCC family protein [Neorhizobium petrolearium]
MELKFKVSGRISKPVEDVFEAVVDPKKLSGYFTTGGAEGRLETGATVTWDFHDFPGAFPVEVVEVEKNRKIVLRWDATEGNPAEQGPENVLPANYQTTVTMTFEPLDGSRTLVTIAEEGWRETPGGLAASYGNCQGWSQMLCAMKAYVEYGINLREGMYK